MRAARNVSVYTDTIVKIRKVGRLDDVEHAEIFITLEEFGEYSFDYYCQPQFENFWLNAHVGSRVELTGTKGHIDRIQLS